MSVFREAELNYLTGGRQLGRIATVGTDGTPHVVPVGWIYNAASEAIALPTPLIRIHPERIVSWGLERARSARTVAT